MKDVPLLPALPLGLVVGPGAPGHEVAGQCRRSPLSRCTKSWPPRHQLWDSWCPGPESPQRSGVLHRKRGGKRPGLLGLRGLFLGLGLVKGKFLPLKGLPGIQAPEAHEKVFRGESDGQKRPKNRKPRKG